MASITTRQTSGGGATVKGSPLTNAELDANLINLNIGLTSSAAITGGTINGTTIGATTASTGAFTTLVNTGQASLGGLVGAESLRVLSPISASSNWLQVSQPATTVTRLGPAGTTVADFRLLSPSFTTFYTGSSADGLTDGYIQLRVSNLTNSVNYIQIYGSIAGNTGGPVLSTAGSDAAVPLTIASKSYGQINLTKTRDATNSSQYLMANVGGLTTDANGGAFWRGFHQGGTLYTVSSVNNFVRLASYHEIETQTDPTVKNWYLTLGNTTAAHNFVIANNTGGNIDFRYAASSGTDLALRVVPGTSFNNYIQISGAANGSPPVISAQGSSDANIPLALNAKGNSAIRIGSNNTDYLAVNTSTVGTTYIQSIGGSTDISLAFTPKGAGTTTISSDVTIAGNLTVNGTTTTINSNTLSVDDKNIELGAVVAVSPTGNITSGSAVVTNLSSTANIIPGSLVSSITGGGTVTLTGTPTVSSVDSATQITLSAAFGGTGSATGVTLTIGGATDTTAAGGGITLKGTSDKTITWSSANGWTSTEDINIATGKIFRIAGTSVLSGSTLGSGITASSLTSLGTQAANLLFTDNTYDIGASGATRPRNLYLAGTATIGSTLSAVGNITNTSGYIGTNVASNGQVQLTASGNTTNTGYVSFYNVANSTRLGYVGYATIAGSGTLNLFTDATTNNTLSLGTNGTERINIGDTNTTVKTNLIFTDNTYDIGASGATRPRTLYAGTSVVTPSLLVSTTTAVANTTGAVSVTYSPASTTGSAYFATGGNTQGGSGYFDFLKVTSTATGVSNASKHFRLNSTGSIEVINSAYSGTSLLTLTDAGILSDVKGDVRAAPVNTQTSAYVIAASDAGKHINITSGGVTVNVSTLAQGDMVTIYNNSASNQTIASGTTGGTATMYLAGTATTGSRTLAQRGLATILCVTSGASAVYVISGAGLT